MIMQLEIGYPTDDAGRTCTICSVFMYVPQLARMLRVPCTTFMYMYMYHLDHSSSCINVCRLGVRALRQWVTHGCESQWLRAAQ